MPPKEHFTRQHALRKGGWLHRLTLNELAMLLVYEEHAGEGGISRPSGATIATAIGHSSTKNLGRLRKALQEHGLIQIISPGGSTGPKDSAVVKMMVPPVDETTSEPSSTPVYHEGGKTEPTPLTGEPYPPQIIPLPPSKSGGYPPQNHSSLNKEEQLREQLREQKEASGNLGVMKIIELGETDPAKAIREFHDAGLMDGWELSSLPAHLNDPACRFQLSVFFVNVKLNKKPHNQISWRGLIRTLSEMGRPAAMESLRSSIANNYAGVFPPRKNGNNPSAAPRRPSVTKLQINGQI